MELDRIKKEFEKKLKEDVRSGNYPQGGILFSLTEKDWEMIVSNLNPLLNHELEKEKITQGENFDNNFDKSAEEFFSLMDNLNWFNPQSEELNNLKSELSKFLFENPQFIEQWNKSQSYSIFVTIVEQLNHEAFYLLIEQLKKSQDSFKREILSLDERGWNIYNWFINGLIQKSLMSQPVTEEDFLLLKKIDSSIEQNSPNERANLLKNNSSKPIDMLEEVYGIEESKFFSRIEEILK